MKKGKRYVISMIVITVLCISSLYPMRVYAELPNYVQNWNDGGGNVNFQYNRSTGNFSVSWSNAGNFVVGLGWSPGSLYSRVGYNVHAFYAVGPAFVGLYGWTKNALIEYYVVEVYSSYRPGGTQTMGSVNSDGGTYTLSKSMRIQQPSIVGTATFQQNWSVRNNPNSIGQNHTITFSNHVNAWRNVGMGLGNTWDSLSFACVAFNSSSGYVNATVWLMP